MKKINKNVLIIAPHGDDEILGCGGSINKYIVSGHNVYVAIMTNAHLGNSKKYSLNFLNKIRNETKNAHNFLGIKNTIFFDYPATQLNLVSFNKIIDSIYELLIKIKPKHIFIPHSQDIHQDHKIINHCSLVASRPIGKLNLVSIFEYETLSETEWSENYSFAPNYFNILNKNNINKKIGAMKFYKSQIKKDPHPRSLNSIKNLSILRGSIVSQKFAESFIIKRYIENE